MLQEYHIYPVKFCLELSVSHSKYLPFNRLQILHRRELKGALIIYSFIFVECMVIG